MASTTTAPLKAWQVNAPGAEYVGYVFVPDRNAAKRLGCRTDPESGVDDFPWIMMQARRWPALDGVYLGAEPLALWDVDDDGIPEDIRSKINPSELWNDC